MPSPHRSSPRCSPKVWPDRIGIASDVASGILHRLNETGYTIAIVGGSVASSMLPSNHSHDPPKTFRVDRWTQGCSALEEYVAAVSDYQVAIAAFDAAVQRWPRAAVTLRQGTRVLRESVKANGLAP